MPATYAHYRFGTMLLPNMPGDVRRTIQRFRRLFEVGLHGPDIFYYQIPGFKKDASFLGIKFHEQTGKEFFQRVVRAVRLERSEASQAYLYGVLCHYCLDSRMNSYIKEQAEQEGISSLMVETEFDRFLLEKDGKVPACSQDLTPHLKLTPGEWETVAKFYPPATAKNVKDSLNNMIFILRLLATPEGTRRKVLTKGVGVLGKEFSGAVMTVEPNPKCQHLNEGLLARYEDAQAQFAEMLSQLQAHMTYSAALEDAFASTF
ncbi:MAG: hypothetical protein E7439_06675 [Ruminococcaceae bacterium]|nr:hypothetical protein [Oscillospiraceae bacterium]